MIRVLRFTCLVLLATVLCRLPASRAAEPLDLSYISSDAVVAVVLHPRQVLAAPEVEFLPIEVVVAAGQQYLGVDPRNIELAIGIGGLSGLTENKPSLGAVLHFAKPYDRDAVQAASARGRSRPITTAKPTFAGRPPRNRRVSASTCRTTARC